MNTVSKSFLGDALESARQLEGQGGAIAYVRAYDIYGVETTKVGAS